RQDVELNRADRGTLEPQYLVAELCEHPADFAVLALTQDDLEPGALALLLEAFDALRAYAPLGEVDAFEQPLELLGRGVAEDLHEVGLLDAEPRVHQAEGEVAVVGEKQ